MKYKLKNTLFSFTALTISSLILYYCYAFFLKKAYPIDYFNYVVENSEKYNVEKELILAVIKSESNFRQDAQSNAGAIGLMQVMPETFDWLQTHNLMPHLDVGHLKDPKTNISYGTYLLSILKKRYNSIVEVICAYNAGIGTVDKWLNDSRYSADGKTLIKIPYADTAIYLKNVLESRRIYKNLYFKNY